MRNFRQNIRMKMNQEISEKRFILFSWSVLMSFLILCLRVVWLQVVTHDEFEQKLIQFQHGSTIVQMPRGRILDRNGQVLVENERKIQVIFQQNDLTGNLNSLAERFVNEVLLVTKDDQTSLIAQYESAMRSAVNTAVVLIDDAQESVISRLGELKSEFPGFSYTFEQKRVHQKEQLLSSVIGQLTTSKQGIPSENAEYFMAYGYPMNASVGRSGLEKQYELLLKGEFSLIHSTDDTEMISEGTFGSDLVLSVDSDLQMKVEEILTGVLKSVEGIAERRTMNRILVAVSRPSTGDVLAMSSIVRTDDGSYVSDDSSVYTLAYEPGSIIKGAIVYAALSEGVVDPGEKLLDEPLKIKGTPEKSSWKNLGWIDEIQALAFSSNVYMMKAALRLGNGVYQYNQPLSVDDNVIELLRMHLSQFGLGVKTGIDVPNEQSGYIGTSMNTGHVLDLAIGQYDTYTLMQILQYINTIATGMKIQPRFVLKALSATTGELIWQNDVNVFHRLSDSASLQRVQEGFRACVVMDKGLCSDIASDVVEIAAKTGTAEATASIELDNGITQRIAAPHNAVVAYAPYDDPQVSVACLIPNAWTGNISQTNLCLGISKEIIELFMNMELSEVNLSE